MSLPSSTPTPTPTSNQYAPMVVKPSVVPPSNGSAAIPATVSTATPDSVIATGLQRNALHNSTVLSGAGMKGGRIRSKSNRSRSRSKSKRSRSKSRRSRSRSKSRRSKSKRGGQQTPTPTPSVTPTPTATVPQFSGSQNDVANARSVASNSLAMKSGALSKYDDPTAPPSYTKLY